MYELKADTFTICTLHPCLPARTIRSNSRPAMAMTRSTRDLPFTAAEPADGAVAQSGSEDEHQLRTRDWFL
jgi:hypothetical protein